MKRLIALGLVLIATTAQARTLPLSNPKPNDNNDPISCWWWYPLWQPTSSGLKRNCAGTFLVDFALPIDAAGTYYPIVRAARPNTSSSVQCNAIALDNNGNWFSVSNYVELTGSATGFQDLVLGAVIVPAGGTLMLRCSLSQGSKVLSVDY